jgi:hypothetical protein
LANPGALGEFGRARLPRGSIFGERGAAAQSQWSDPQTPARAGVNRGLRSATRRGMPIREGDQQDCLSDGTDGRGPAITGNAMEFSARPSAMWATSGRQTILNTHHVIFRRAHAAMPRRTPCHAPFAPIPGDLSVLLARESLRCSHPVTGGRLNRLAANGKLIGKLRDRRSSRSAGCFGHFAGRHSARDVPSGTSA